MVFALQKEDRTMIEGLHSMSMGGGTFTSISNNEKCVLLQIRQYTPPPHRHDCLTDFIYYRSRK
jgi:hypothetical protein